MTGHGTGHCPTEKIISNVTKNEEAGHGPVPPHIQLITMEN